MFFLYQIFVSFFRFGKFSVIISSNTFSIPFFLSSSGALIMYRLAFFFYHIVKLVGCFLFPFFVIMSVVLLQ